MRENNKKSILIRLWQYQAERVPVIVILILALLSMGAVYKFSSSPLINYLGASAIIFLYLIQIRVSDEKKDLDHDNKYYKNRPVQRGLVSLRELSVVGLVVIIMQLIIYLSYLNLNIIILGLISQCYALLTRKEFFIRSWLRRHLLVYNMAHQVQLIILFFAVINIIPPQGMSVVILLLFVLCNTVTVELARKTLTRSEDRAKDSYSFIFGYSKIAVIISFFASVSMFTTIYLVNYKPMRPMVVFLPIVIVLLLFIAAYRYSKVPCEKNKKVLQALALITFISCMLGVIIGV